MSSPESPPREDDMERVCVVGLGSTFGDDRAGWQVVERLEELLAAAPRAGIRLARVSTPANLLDLIQSGDRLIVIDACQGAGPPGSYVRLDWPGESIPQARAGCGHNVSLSDAIKLAATLGQLTSSCEIWCLEGRQFGWEQPLSADVVRASEKVAKEIFHSLAPGRGAIGTPV